MKIGIIQPNIDPWDKWSGSSSGYSSIRTYLTMTDTLVHSQRPDLVLWPETAVPYFLLLERNRPLLDEVRRGIDTMDVPVLTGLPHAVVYPDSNTAPRSAKRWRITGERYDSYNAAALIQPGLAEIPWYGKMKMVPLAERVPYAEVFAFFDFLRWGVGIGGWAIGKDTVVFSLQKSGAKFATVICYESVYPDFVAEFVRRGAEFLTIITIDSWWGRMPGAFQHQQYALLRAIENRRWIARCAVGGISSIIDPYGRVRISTELFTRRSFAGEVHRSTSESFYTRHGDWLPQIALTFALFFVAAALGERFVRRSRNAQWEEK